MMSLIQIFLDYYASFGPIHDRHVEVEYYSSVVIWWILLHQVDSLLTILNGINYIKLALEGLLEGHKQERVVICNKTLV